MNNKLQTYINRINYRKIIKDIREDYISYIFFLFFIFLFWPRSIWFSDYISYQDALFSPFLTASIVPADIIAVFILCFLSLLLLKEKYKSSFFAYHLKTRYLYIFFSFFLVSIISYQFFLNNFQISSIQAVWFLRLFLVYFFIYISLFFIKQKNYIFIYKAIGIMIILNSLLAFYQVLFGHSFGLPGEPYLDINIPGPAKILIGGNIFLRGIGFMPHANILSCIGILGLLASTNLNKYKNKFFTSVILFSILAILLSMSRSGLLSLLLFTIFYLKNLNKHTSKILFLSIPVIIIIFFTRGLSVLNRLDDFYRSIDIIKHFPFGSGLLTSSNLFTQNEAWMQFPPHSLILNIITEFGLVFGIFMILFFLIAVIFLKRKKIIDTRPLIVISPFILFDHMFYSLPIGIWLFAILIFISINKNKEEYLE